jgi:hypothetical protein
MQTSRSKSICKGTKGLGKCIHIQLNYKDNIVTHTITPPQRSIKWDYGYLFRIKMAGVVEWRFLTLSCMKMGSLENHGGCRS